MQENKSGCLLFLNTVYNSRLFNAVVRGDPVSIWHYRTDRTVWVYMKAVVNGKWRR